MFEAIDKNAGVHTRTFLNSFFERQNLIIKYERVLK